MSKSQGNIVEKLDTPMVHSEIVWMFLDKLEKLNERERATLILTIEIINNPLFLVKS